MIPYEINVREKTGFRNLVPAAPVIIFDEYARPFYDTSRLEKQVNEFNLPPGKYTIGAGQIRPMVNPVKFDMLPLPEPMRWKRKNPEHFKIVVGDVPFKCLVDWDKEEIIYDRMVADMPLPTLVYIFWHECGHRFYGIPYKPKPWTVDYAERYTYAEACCDRYAYNKMIEAGYNPSQIGEAQIGTVTNDARNEVMTDSIAGDVNFYEYDGPRVNNCDCNFYGSPGYILSNQKANMPTVVDYSGVYTSTPSTEWDCINWVNWHKDLLKAYQDGRLAKFDYAKALAETNKVFAYHWEQSAGFSKKFWGKCGYEEGFFNYFRDIGYTDHISFIAGLTMPLLSGSQNIAEGAGGLIGNIGKNLFLYLSVALLLYILILRK